MRRGEILALKWRDMDEGHTVARVTRALEVSRGVLAFEPPKTPRSRRAVVLPAFLRPYLARQLKDQATRRDAHAGRWYDLGLVVDGGEGSPMNPDTLSSGWVRFLRANGLPKVRFHDLRHAHATFMLAKGIHPKVGPERARSPTSGHSSRAGVLRRPLGAVRPGGRPGMLRASSSDAGCPRANGRNRAWFWGQWAPASHGPVSPAPKGLVHGLIIRRR